jgi:soluble lytic murein transglycosylase
MLAQFGQLEYALAAYNAGPHRVTKWLSGLEQRPLDEFVEMIPFSETRKYTKRVLASYWNYTRIYGSSSTLQRGQSNE